VLAVVVAAHWLLRLFLLAAAVAAAAVAIEIYIGERVGPPVVVLVVAPMGLTAGTLHVTILGPMSTSAAAEVAVDQPGLTVLLVLVRLPAGTVGTAPLMVTEPVVTKLVAAAVAVGLAVIVDHPAGPAEVATYRGAAERG
jgi:hypothetical protein